VAEPNYVGSYLVIFISVKDNNELMIKKFFSYFSVSVFRNARMFPKWERWQLSVHIIQP